MPEGTEASVWAHPTPASVPPVRQASKDSATGAKPRGGRGSGPRRGRGGGRKHSTAGTAQPTTDSPSTPAPTQAPAAAPTPDTPKSDPPRKTLIERMTLTPDVPAVALVAPTTVSARAAPDSKPAANRPRKGRADSNRKGPPAKVNTAPETQQQPAEKEEPKSAGSHETKDAPPHIGPELAPAPNPVSALADKVQTLTLPSHPTTPRPYTPSAIDWAVETEDGSLPDLDDWGVHPVKSTSPADAATNKEENNKTDGITNTKSTDLGNGPPGINALATAPPHTETNRNGIKRRDSKPREQGRSKLSVPGRNGTNAHSSSRPVTPSSAGFAPSPRGTRRPELARTSSRASTVNDPPHITVTPNPNPPAAFNPDDKSQDKSAGGLGLDLSETEPVFASLNDPPLPAPEDPHINPVRAPHLHPQRGARGRGGRGRGGGTNHQHHSQLGPRHSEPGPMAVHLPPSPHTPSLHMPPSPYMPPSQFPPNGGYGMQQHGHGGYPMPQHNPYGYTPPSGPGNGNGFGHQHSHSHPQPTQSSHGHQRAHSRPVIAVSGISQLTRHLQGTTSPPPKSKPDVSASS